MTFRCLWLGDIETGIDVFPIRSGEGVLEDVVQCRSTLEQGLAALAVQEESCSDELAAPRNQTQCVTCDVACGEPWWVCR